MGFNVAEYAKKKKNTAGAADPAAPGPTTRSGGFSVRDYALEKTGSSGINTDKLTEYQTFRERVVGYSDAITADAKKRRGQYQDRPTFGTYFDSKNAEAGDLLKEAYAYRDYWKQNAGAYDRLSESGTAGADYLADVEGLIEYLNGSRDALFDEERFWSGFADEEEYNGFLEQQERNARLSTFDLEGGRNSLAEKEAQLDEAKKAKNTASTVLSGVKRYGIQAQREEAQAALDEATAAYEAIQAEVTALERDIYDAETLQKGLSYNGLLSAADFGQYSSQGAAIKNPALSDVEKGVTIFGRNFGGEKPGNIVTYSRDNWEQIAMGEANNSQLTGRSLYHYMTDDEVGIYNYLLAKEGEEAAQEYLDYLEETLNYRFGTAQGENIRGIENSVGRTLMTGLYGFGTGLDQFASGAKQFFTGDKRPTSATQYGSSFIREDLKNSGPTIAGGSLGQMAYDTTTTIGNMAPSILVSAVTGGLGAPAAVASGVGATTMGVSSAGNAYAQKLDEGYSKSQARTYSTLVGAAEGGLQYLLGGIGALGGVTDDVILAKVKAIDNALARVALTGAVRIGSEITEEELQLWLEPAFDSLIFGTEYDAPTFEDMAYTAIVTAFSTGLLESGNIAATGFTPAAPVVDATSEAPATVEPAASPAAPSVSADSMTNSDIAAELVNAGATEAEAESLAPVIAAVLTGEEISGNQAGAIAKNEAAVSVLESTTGEQINTDAPLGEVKSTIRGLASRHNAATEATATEDTPAQTQHVQAEKTAPPQPMNGQQSVKEFAATLGKAGEKVFNDMYNEEQNAVSYVDAMMKAYNAGKNGGTLGGISSRLVAAPQLEAAYIAGQADAQNSGTAVARTVEPRYTNLDNNLEGASESDGETAVYLRNGSQRAGSSYPGGQVSAVEGGAGQNTLRTIQGRPADGEATRLSYGEKVSTASLGIGGGSTKASIRLVTGGETASTKAAKQLAKERGLRLVLFAGDNLSIRQADGTVASVRGMYVSGDRVFVRADHPRYTADQLMRHEAGHDAVAKGEVDIEAVKGRLAELYGEDYAENIAKMYEQAYRGSGISAEGVWEECICDSLGDMNVFDDTEAAKIAEEFLPRVKQAAQDVRGKNGTTRAPPSATDAKTSMELDDLADNIRKAPGIKWNGGRAIELSRSEYAAVTSRISTRYHYANTRHDGVQVIDRTTDGKNAQHYVYLYTDHGFGSYQIVGRLTYGRNDALISYVKEVVVNDRTVDSTAEGIFEGTGELWDFYEHADSGRVAHHDRAAYDGNEQADTGSRGVRAGSDRRTGRADTDGYDDGGNAGEVKTRFSMESPVEQTQTLMALHNMHEEKLRSTLKLGAWPSPSIAIVQAATGHADYGAYSAVFPRSTIDPEADYRNRVYGSDAWTPTHSNAQIEYEVNFDVLHRFDRMVADLTRDFAGGALYHTSPLGGIVSEETSDDIDKIAEKLSKQESVQAAYLAHLGEEVEPSYREKKFDNLGNELLKQYIDNIGAQELARLVAELETSRKVPDEALEAVRGIIVEDWAERNKTRLSQKPELIDKYKKVQHDRIDEYRVERFIRNAWDYYEDGGATTGEIDRYATAEQVTNRLSELSPEGDFGSIERMVQDWVRGEIEGLLGEPGIYNGAEYRDRMGNRKSFDKTHWPVTVENIVRAMNNADARGANMFGYGAAGLAATATPEYGSVEEIHADEGRLHKVPEDEYKQILADLDAELMDVRADIMATTEAHSSNRFEEQEIIGYIISQAAAGKRTAASIKSTFAREGYAITAEQAKNVKTLLDHVAKVPTGYFEAKPRRVVEFNEAVAVLAPSDAPADLISEMKDKGMNVLTYEAGNDQQRLELLNSLEGVKFSRELDNEGRQLTEGQADYFADSKMVDAQGRLKVMYRGGSGDFTVFDRRKSSHSNLYGRGFYFTDSKTHAEQYGNARAFYLNITDPVPTDRRTITREQMLAFLEAVAENEDDYSFENYGYGATPQSVLRSVFSGKSDFAMLYDVSQTAIGDMVAAVELFNSVNGTGFDGLILDTETVTFRSEQAKSTTNENPTSDPDIRFSRELDAIKAEYRDKTDHLYLHEKTDGTISLDNMVVKKAYRDQGVGTQILQDIIAYADATGKTITLTPTSEFGTKARLTKWYKEHGFVENKGRNADYRLSDTMYRLPRSKYSRELENVELLREQNEALREKAEYWRGQTKRTTAENRAVRQADVDKLARRLTKSYGSSLETKELSTRLKELGEYLVRDGDGKNELTWREVKDRAVSIARDIIDSIDSADYLNDEMYRQYSDLRNYLRKTSIIYGKEYHGDIPDFGEFRKRNFGRLNLKTNGRTNIDAVYEEMSSTWPEFFDSAEQTHPTDQIQHIIDVLDSLRPVYENPFSYDMATALEYVSNDIIDGLLSEDVRQAPPTFADRQAAKLDSQKAKDRQKLDRLRAQKNERIAEIRKQGQERTREALRKVRADRDAKIKGIKEHYAETAKQRRERAADSKARTRLLKIVKRLQNKKLPAVNRALLDEYIADIDTVAKSLTDGKAQDLRELRDWYEDQRDNNPDFFADPAVEKALSRLSKRHIADLSAKEVEDLTNVLLNIENELRTQKKLIDSAERRDVYNMGVQTITDIENSRGSKGGVLGIPDRYITTETLSPVRQVRRMTGYVDNSPLYVLTNELADGQRKMFDYQRRAGDLFLKWTQDEKFVDRICGKNTEEIEIAGIGKDGPTTVRITPAMRMSLYLHSLNSQNMKHVAGGGVTVPDMKLYKKGKIAEAYARGTTIKLTPSEVRSITSRMTAEEKAFALAAHGYFNGMSQDSINEVSEKLKGYSLAKVEDYFPINTDTSFTRSDFEALKFDGTIEGMGFLKERINSSAPIMLRDMNTVLKQSIDNTAKYVGLGIPVRNFNKVWGVTKASYDEEGNRTSYESSVQQAVKKKWGEDGYRYIENMMTDLNTGRPAQDNWAKVLNKIKSNYAGAVLTLNASVAMKQAASYPTAGAVLGFKPLARAMADFGKVDIALINKYTPLQWYRTQGFSTQELGDMAKRNKSLPKALNWVQGVDLLTTRKLWKASEYYVRSNHKELARGSEAYYRAVADIYNQVIEETQPNYTTMQRPQLLRSENSLMQNLSMFKTQPFQNFNILYDAMGNLRAKQTAYTNTGTEEAKAALGKAKQRAVWAIVSQLAQLAVFSGMTFAWNLFRGKLSKYKDDDEDEMTVPSALKGIGKDMLGGAAAMVPFGSDVWELLSSKLFGDTYYGMDAVTVQALTDAVSSLSGLTDLLTNTVKRMAKGEAVDWNETRLKFDNYFDDISKALGMPYENVNNLFNAFYLQSAKAVQGEYLGTYAAMKLTTSPSTYGADYYDLLYKAFTTDQEAYETIYADMIEWDCFATEKRTTAEAIASAMENRIKADQGVTEVADLDSRYLSPEQQTQYDRTMRTVRGGSIWGDATAEQQDKVEGYLYDLIMGNSDGAKMQEKIDGGAEYGIDETVYLLYKLALSMTDEPTESGKLGSYTNDEVEEAIRMIPGLTDKERDYLWIAQGKNENKIPKW